MASETFNKFKSSLNRGVTAISIKTSSSLEKAKIRTHIESIKLEIDRLIVTIGELAYEIWEKGESDFSSLNEQFDLIKQKKEEILQLENEYESIDERDNQILGASNTDKPSAPQTMPEEAAGIVCPNCGTAYANPVRFCRRCGYKIEES